MEYYLWQLFNIEKDVASTLAELEVDRATLQELNREQEQLESEIKALKKNQAVFTKEALLLEKKIAKKKLELDKKVNYLWSDSHLLSVGNTVVEFVYFYV